MHAPNGRASYTYKNKKRLERDRHAVPYDERERNKDVFPSRDICLSVFDELRCSCNYKYVIIIKCLILSYGRD